MNDRAFHPDAGTRDNFRNANGVALKLANFVSLDPDYDGAGMSAHSAGDELTWDEFAGDVDLLAAAVTALRSDSPVPAQPSDQRTSPQRRPIEQQWSPTFEVSPRTGAIEGRRREADLVLRFAEWLTNRGADVSSHHYDVVRPPLRNDLFDDSENRMWEAKGSPGRSEIRTAVGQLLDYRRFESGDVHLGVLLPRRPTEDLLAYISSVPAAVAWPDPVDGFVVLPPNDRPS